MTLSRLPPVQSWKSVDLSIARSVMKNLNFAFMNIFPEFTMHKPENLHTCIAQVFKKSLCINLYKTYYADIHKVWLRKIYPVCQLRIKTQFVLLHKMQQNLHLNLSKVSFAQPITFLRLLVSSVGDKKLDLESMLSASRHRLC